MSPKLTFAPMEGITGHVFRRAFCEFFEAADLFYTPFIAPDSVKIFRTRELNDILPEHNQGIKVVPQILTNRADLFKETARRLKEYGYDEVNLNLGCPSRVVVTKGKGSGFLEDPQKLRCFLEDVFSETDVKVSVKTRIGLGNEEEFDALLSVFSDFPISELIVHPRLQTDYYKGVPRLSAFQMAYERYDKALGYNGDIRCPGDYERIVSDFPSLSSVMIGRGLLTDPWLISQIRGHEYRKDTATLLAFFDRLATEYLQLLSGEKDVVMKLKELLLYEAAGFENADKVAKAIKKSNHLTQLRAAVAEGVFSEASHNQ